jgi:hypothetical protein
MPSRESRRLIRLMVWTDPTLLGIGVTGPPFLPRLIRLPVVFMKGQPARGRGGCQGTGNADDGTDRRRRRPGNQTDHHHAQPEKERDTDGQLTETYATPEMIEADVGGELRVALKKGKLDTVEHALFVSGKHDPSFHQ